VIQSLPVCWGRITGNLMKRSFFAIALTSLMTFTTNVAGAGPVAQGLLSQSEQALVEGNPQLALELVQDVVAHDPSNYAALIIISLAYADLGRDDEAAQTAQKAYQFAKDNDERLRAARIVAGARFQLGQYTRAQWWLRRAANDAETPQETATVAQEFARIRAANPLTINLSLSVAPSDNINNGSEAESFFLEGLDVEFLLPESSLALSGIEYAGDLFATYALSRDQTQVTQIQGYLFGRTFSLSSQSQAKVPELSGSDYAMIVTEASVNHSRLLNDGWGPTRLGVHAGKVWFGGDPLWDYTKLSFGQSIPDGDRDILNLWLSAEDRTARNPIISDTQVLHFSAVHQHSLQSNDVIAVTLSGLSHYAAFETDTYTDYWGNIEYRFHQPMLGTRLSVSAGIGYKNYEEFTLSLDGRRDRYASLGGTVVFDDVTYFGFAPTLTVTATRTESNVTQFTTSQLQARVGIQSTF